MVIILVRAVYVWNFVHYYSIVFDSIHAVGEGNEPKASRRRISLLLIFSEINNIIFIFLKASIFNLL